MRYELTKLYAFTRSSPSSPVSPDSPQANAAAWSSLITAVRRLGRPAAPTSPQQASPTSSATSQRHRIHFINRHIDKTHPGYARAIVEGASIADFDPDTYRSDRKDQSLQSFTLLTADATPLAAAFAEGEILAAAQLFARTLVNEPGNVLVPLELGRRAKAELEPLGIKVEVFSTEKLHELKMGAFAAVAQGSENPPALIVMTYEPAKKPAADAPVIGLVGKGITFDTGGISIKPAEGMEKMKYDMAGAAAMIGAMRAVAQLKPRHKIVAVICSAENMPDGHAFKPGDVVTAMSGKTIEIMNTDAEGRLVLADGLHYAQTLGCTHLINAATLTGACVVALGMLNAGVFSNDEATYRRSSTADSSRPASTTGACPAPTSIASSSSRRSPTS